MKKQITPIERQLLEDIKGFTSLNFPSDYGNWAYINSMFTLIDRYKMRTLITSLQTKGILTFYGSHSLYGSYNQYVQINKGYYKESGKRSDVTGSPEIELINLELK